MVASSFTHLITLHPDMPVIRDVPIDRSSRQVAIDAALAEPARSIVDVIDNAAIR
jgi:hypothetical protein